MYSIVKVVVSAVLIYCISEVSKRSSFMGGVLASLPLTSILAFIWLYVDTQDKEKVIALSSSVFWLVVPSLSFFILFPLLLRKLDFGISMVLSLGTMLAFYYGMVFLLSKVGVTL